MLRGWAYTTNQQPIIGELGLNTNNLLRLPPAVERLDLALLIDPQHKPLVRWAHVDPDDVDDLLLELRIVRDLEDEMRLETGLRRDALNRRVRNAMALAIERTDQCVAPGGVSVTVCLRDNLGLDLIREWRPARRSCLVAAWLSKAKFRRDIDAGLQAEGVQAFMIQAMALKFCALHEAQSVSDRLTRYLEAWLTPGRKRSAAN
jgi:hypothetical protein